MKECIIEGCGGSYYGKGFCKKHHQWRWTRGLLPPTKTNIEIFNLNTSRKKNGCVEWLAATNNNGYPTFRRDGVLYAHRWAYQHFVGDIGVNHVLHRCHNPICVNPDHLYLGTHQQNMRDMADHGSQKGEKNPGSKLKEHEVLKIRQLYEDGNLQKDIALEYHVSAGTIHSIVSRKNWGWLNS